MFEWVDHTAELELLIEAGSPEEVFGDALRAVGELLGEPHRGGRRVTERLELDAADRPALLAGWIEELAFLAETRGLLAERVASLELDGPRLRATVEALPGDPRHLVKAVTYHRLRFERRGERWIASAVLDV